LTVTETLSIVGGRFRVAVRDTSTSEAAEIIVGEDEAVRFTMRPGIAHAFKNIGTTTGYLLVYADKPFDPADIHPVALLD